MTTHDPIAALEAAFHSRDNHQDVTWLDGFKSGIDQAIQIIEDDAPPSIRPLQELQNQVSEYREFWAHEDPGLTDLLDDVHLVLEAITRHEYDRDYTAAVADASRALQLKTNSEGDEL